MINRYGFCRPGDSNHSSTSLKCGVDGENQTTQLKRKKSKSACGSREADDPTSAERVVAPRLATCPLGATTVVVVAASIALVGIVRVPTQRRTRGQQQATRAVGAAARRAVGQREEVTSDALRVEDRACTKHPTTTADHDGTVLARIVSVRSPHTAAAR